ncbi:uncharacterized protein BO66DRAFT_166012 [Aspergillus aculeatinus CBS 121060]|uniref:Uncharacterized protein n=1 Tax=Aspergillus aculeatinus CBS 121060 TaxID=1448322 RepID=A0ACD1GZN5_9EURO|nr:hypothetical protein BO66DRAFT_166012 [Aspergillus aculeatinus CBS 121060]RAH66769.1 hypothetical protein BO66DRAFT_166012 [Aspergillus aculeatinus CBS 121060]
MPETLFLPQAYTAEIPVGCNQPQALQPCSLLHLAAWPVGFQHGPRANNPARHWVLRLWLHSFVCVWCFFAVGDGVLTSLGFFSQVRQGWLGQKLSSRPAHVGQILRKKKVRGRSVGLLPITLCLLCSSPTQRAPLPSLLLLSFFTDLMDVLLPLSHSRHDLDPVGIEGHGA